MLVVSLKGCLLGTLESLHSTYLQARSSDRASLFVLSVRHSNGSKKSAAELLGLGDDVGPQLSQRRSRCLTAGLDRLLAGREIRAADPRKARTQHHVGLLQLEGVDA